MSTLTIGTDCSGMEAPIQALQNLGIPFDHIFSSDTDQYVRTTINENFAPKHLFTDCTTRPPQQTPHVDVYMAGFPCQPFSTAGKREGFQDAQGRGLIYSTMVSYIQHNFPAIFIFENVKGLIHHDQGRTLQRILADLQGIRYNNYQAYDIYHQVLNTKDHGIPQNRPRWYCVGVLKGKGSTLKPFSFPNTVPMQPMHKFLDTVTSSRPLTKRTDNLSHQAALNIAKAKHQIQQKYQNWQNDPIIVD